MTAHKTKSYTNQGRKYMRFIQYIYNICMLLLHAALTVRSSRRFVVRLEEASGGGAGHQNQWVQTPSGSPGAASFYGQQTAPTTLGAGLGFTIESSFSYWRNIVYKWSLTTCNAMVFRIMSIPRATRALWNLKNLKSTIRRPQSPTMVGMFSSNSGSM
jgi:hypothetical protein